MVREWLSQNSSPNLTLIDAVPVTQWLLSPHDRHMLLLLSRCSRVQLCDPIDSSPPGFPIPGILQARTLEWVAISFSNV